MPRKFRFGLDLQLFASDGLIDFDEDTTGDEGGDTNDDDDLDGFSALDPDDYEDLEDEPDGDEPEGEDDKTEPETPDEPETPADESEKETQSPDKNAEFAEQRRQRQLQTELEKLQAASPEFKLAKQLAELYGTTPEAMLEQVQDSLLEKQAKESGVTVEYLKKQQDSESRIAGLQDQINQFQFQSWQTRMDVEASQLKTAYPMLTDEDVTAARTHMLQTLQRVDLPLEEVAFALHGKKIIQAQKEIQRNELLAEMSGRKNSPLPPKAGKTAPATTLTAEEQYAAKMMGVSEADYLKYK